MALSRGFRRILLYIAFLVFAAASYALILYAQGYSYSFEDFEFVLTGALTIDASEQANVFIDGEHAGTTSVLSHEFNKGRLLPDTYSVRLQKDGFSEWSKSVIIQEGLVTDFPHVVLLSLEEERASSSRGAIEKSFQRSFPRATPTPDPLQSPSPSPEPSREVFILEAGRLSMDGRTIATGVNGYAESPDGDKLLWWTRNELSVMWMRDTEYQPFRLSGEQETITRLSNVIDRAGWWPDGHHVTVRTGTKYRVIELDDRGGSNIIEL